LLVQVVDVDLSEIEIDGNACCIGAIVSLKFTSFNSVSFASALSGIIGIRVGDSVSKGDVNMIG